MAAVVPSADQATDLLKNLSIDSQAKTLEVPEPTKKTSVNKVNGQVQSGNKTGAPLVSDYVDPSLAYYPNGYPYFYGYDATTTDWDEYNRYMSSDDSAHGVYGYGYAPYAPYSPAGSPVPTVGQDGQYYGQQYQYPSPFFTPLTPTGNGYPAAAPAKGDTTAPVAADKPILAVDTAKGNTNGVGAKGNTVPGPLKPTTYQYNANGSYGSGGLNSYQDPRFGYGGVTSPISWMDNSMYTNPQRRNNTNSVPVSYGKGVASKTPTNLMNQRPLTGMNTTSGYMNGLYPNNLYGQYGSTYRSGYGYGSTAYDMQNNGRGWMTVDNKYKPRGRANGFFGYNNENSDGLNELNRGPRSRITKNPKVFTPIAIAVKGQEMALAPTESVEKDVKEVAVKEVTVTPDREQYNKTDFSETYADAKFFIIKSYSEDDVHKSIKYNVWASTQNGNKKLEAAYQEAQQKPEGCPIFLFFSVNTSGQFVGVAEMVGPVDLHKSLEYWQQDKWIGCFPVKWHIVKDLPNSLLKHIILENNENKPVTNSRDTQEVKLDQGLQVIKIFKEHSSKQCILDDFEFYEDRQKKIQEKKAKQQQFQKQAWEGKPAIDEKIKEGIKADATKSVDVVTALVNEVKLVNNVQNDVANGVEDVAKPLEEKVVANGIANGC